MIPRYQRLLFFGLLGGIVAMALVLLRGCEQAREKLTRHRDETPLAAPTVTASETVRYAVASDATGGIALAERELALPAETTARARVLLGRLLAEYSYKGSAHPLQSGPSVDDVFLLDLPLRAAAAITPSPGAPGGAGSIPGQPESNPREERTHADGGQLAIINLHGAFADAHPSGIEAETLTIDSIIGTLYANFPRIQQVRFLVDGQPRETLNGHADLTRTYAVADMTSKSAAQVGP